MLQAWWWRSFDTAGSLDVIHSRQADFNSCAPLAPAVLDTADPESRAAFLKSHAKLVEGVVALAKRIQVRWAGGWVGGLLPAALASIGELAQPPSPAVAWLAHELQVDTTH